MRADEREVRRDGACSRRPRPASPSGTARRRRARRSAVRRAARVSRASSATDRARTRGRVRAACACSARCVVLVTASRGSSSLRRSTMRRRPARARAGHRPARGATSAPAGGRASRSATPASTSAIPPSNRTCPTLANVSSASRAASVGSFRCIHASMPRPIVCATAPTTGDAETRRSTHRVSPPRSAPSPLATPAAPLRPRPRRARARLRRHRGRTARRERRPDTDRHGRRVPQAPRTTARLPSAPSAHPATPAASASVSVIRPRADGANPTAPSMPISRRRWTPTNSKRRKRPDERHEQQHALQRPER